MSTQPAVVSTGQPLLLSREKQNYWDQKKRKLGRCEFCGQRGKVGDRCCKPVGEKEESSE